MDGLAVLRRRGEYRRDMQRMRLRQAIAQDSGRADEAQRYSAALEARQAMRAMETEECGRLVSQLDPEAGLVIYLRRVRGMTLRQTAGETHRTVESVRGIQRRAERMLAQMTSEIDKDDEYNRLAKSIKGC